MPNNAIYTLLTGLAILVLFSIICYFQFSIKWATNVEALLDSKSAYFSRVFKKSFLKTRKRKPGFKSQFFFFPQLRLQLLVFALRQRGEEKTNFKNKGNLVNQSMRYPVDRHLTYRISCINVMEGNLQFALQMHGPSFNSCGIRGKNVTALG